MDKKEKDENDVEDMIGYEVRLAGLGWEDRVAVMLHAGSGLLQAESGMVN